MNRATNATVAATGGLNLRRGAGTQHAVIGVLPNRTRVAIDAEQGEWRSVDTPLGRGFVHCDFLTVDPDYQLPPAERRHTVAPDETLSAIALRYGLHWREIATLNALANPNILNVGQVLRLPAAGGVTTGAAASPPSGLLIVTDPLSLDGTAIVTSSSAEGHHRPYGGAQSADLDVIGRSQGAPVRFGVASPGAELRGVVARIRLACRSGVVADGGHSVAIDIERRAGDRWLATGAWLLYAHLDPVLPGIGEAIAPGQIIGHLGPPEGPEYRSSCATASHVHVEANRDGQVARSGRACGERLMTLTL